MAVKFKDFMKASGDPKTVDDFVTLAMSAAHQQAVHIPNDVVFGVIAELKKRLPITKEREDRWYHFDHGDVEVSIRNYVASPSMQTHRWLMYVL